MPKQKIIDCETYRSIKEMSHGELQVFLIHYADGLMEDNRKVVDLRDIENYFWQIKGIGEKHLEEVMAEVEKHLACKSKPPNDIEPLGGFLH